MNRRSFLQRFGIGVSAALALAALPVEAIQALTTEQAAKRLACEHLRRIYNAWCDAHHGQQPALICVSRGLYDAYSAELRACERVTTADTWTQDTPDLMFKGTRLRAVTSVQGWDVSISAQREPVFLNVATTHRPTGALSGITD